MVMRDTLTVEGMRESEEAAEDKAVTTAENTVS